MAKGFTFAGRFFHTWQKDDEGREVIQCQGVVEADFPDEKTLFVMFFSWLTGGNNGAETVPYKRFMQDERWTWYESGEEMNAAYERESRFRESREGHHFKASMR